jgi:hypothetical protein
MVTAWYRHLLDRSPTAVELQTGMQLLGRSNGRALLERLLLSGEYAGGHGGGTQAGWRRALARDVLDAARLPANMVGGRSRRELVRRLLASLQARLTVLNQTHLALLGRTADPGTLREMREQLRQGQTVLEVLADRILTHPEYLVRMNG